MTSRDLFVGTARLEHGAWSQLSMLASFHGSGRSYVSTGGEKTWMVLPSCEPYELQYQPARQDVSPCAIVALTEMEVTNHSLIGFVNSLTGENLCLVL